MDDGNFLHLFKEALTAILLSENELTELLNNKNYKGNTEVHDLNIIDLSSNMISLREYLRNNFHQYQAEGKNFSVFIRGIISVLSPKIKEFSNKKIFWNKNEQEIKNGNEQLLEMYAEPIKIHA